jgi:GDP-L-fucose synthase|tara:strand:+ start:5145 stop:6032 length:888 start_codon:yes stop_codon:yes gene_type:complete
MVGSSISNILSKGNDYELVLSNRNTNNLFDLSSTKKHIKDVNPDCIINAAAKVGGININNEKRFEFITENLKINMNILESCLENKNIKIINLGSSCIYPLDAENPLKEEYIMTGKLEPTNSPYAMAKLSAIEIGDAMTKQFGHKITNLMPTNLYGPNDNFSENDSHVIPGLIFRMHNAKINNEESFSIWGSGKPLREFLYVDDLSEAIKLIIDKDIDQQILNVGSSQEISIIDLAKLIKKVVCYDGELTFDSTKPDGNPRKLLDSSKMFSYGWEPNTQLEDGIRLSYDWFLKNSA